MDSVESLYSSLEENDKGILSWKGELYFELHRGTYTSQAHNKRMNRFSEILLRNIELLYVFATCNSSLEPTRYDWDSLRAVKSNCLMYICSYPKEELDKLWKLTLLLVSFLHYESKVTVIFRNQFHDVLPGSSIGSVYKDSDEVRHLQYILFESTKHYCSNMSMSCLLVSL
jgi:alpha-mannosidase